MSTATLAEIAEALGVSKQGAQKRANKEAWRATREGNRSIYTVADLPTDVREALLRRAVAAHTPALPAPVQAPALPVASSPSRALSTVVLDDSTEADRMQEFSAQQVLGRIRQIQAHAGVSLKQACKTLIAAARSGLLPAAQVNVLRSARDARGRQSPDGLPSDRSLIRWASDNASGKSLRPKRVAKDMSVQPWYALAIALKQRPQKPTTTWVHEQIVAQWNPAWGAEPPSYDQVYRFFAHKYSKIDQLRGQHQGSSLRAHLFYQHRKAYGLAPFTEVHADGWNTHYKAPHPVTGEFVTHEVWHYHDVATRYVTPVSVGRSESFEVISKGLENCMRVGGVPAILQTDSTGSVKNARMELDPVASIAARAGTTIVHPKTVGNSQANGIAENFNKFLDREARELATYQGKGMDSLALRRVGKLTEKMVKAARAGDLAARDQFKREATLAGRGLVFDSYAQALDWLNSKVEKFNHSPHSELPRITDPVTGKRRHQTPVEALQEAREAGWEPVALEEHHLIDLFRPHLRKTIRRGAVSPFGGQRYHHEDLQHHEGEEVMVAVDIMDGSRVWVKTLNGQLLCEAAFVEATGYRAQSMYEFAEEKRRNAQVKRKSDQIAAIEERMSPVLEAPDEPVIDTAMQLFGERLGEVTKQREAELIPLRPAAEVTPEKRQYEDITDVAMYLFGDVVDEQEKENKAAQQGG